MTPFLAIIVTIVLGAAILCLISQKFDLLEYIGLSFLIGMGTQTVLMFLLNFLGVVFHIRLILMLSFGVILPAAAYLFICRRHRFRSTAANGRADRSRIISYNAVWLACFGIAAFVIYVISLKSMFWPTFSSDALGSFDVFAKGLAGEGKIINSLILEKRVGYGAAYPPLYSLSLAYAYMSGFELSKIIPTLFYISFVISFYAVASKFSNPTNAIFFTLLAVLSPEILAQSAINITSVPHAVYASLTIAYVYAWYKFGDNRYLYLSAGLAGLNCFIRSEGIVYVFSILIFFSALVVRTKQYRLLAVYTCIALGPFILWQFFLMSNNDIMEKYVLVNIIKYPNLDETKITMVLSLALKNITSSRYFGYVFPLFIAAAALNCYRVIKKKDNAWLLLMTLFPFFGYLALIIQFDFKSDSLENIMNYSGKRFFFGIVFLMWFYISNNLYVKRAFAMLEDKLNFS